MSVLIKGEKMPASCWSCPCCNGEFGFCQVNGISVVNIEVSQHPDWCPLVEVMNDDQHDALVHCGECKYYRESELLAPNRFCYRLVDKEGKPVGYNFDRRDFCSYGERRE